MSTLSDLARLNALKKNTKNKPTSAQRTIPYLQMYRDGICKVTKDYYSKTVEFEDINYQLAQEEEQEAIFSEYMHFLDYFDAKVNIQLTFMNVQANASDYKDVIEMPSADDEFDEIRTEYGNILKSQHGKGNNGIVRKKYITFGLNAESLKDAKVRLEIVESGIIGNFKQMGVKAYPLNGKERLAIFHKMMTMDNKSQFNFSYDDLPKSGLSTKDYIAPDSFDFRSKNSFMLGMKHARVSRLLIKASEFSDRTLNDVLGIDESMIVNMHIKPCEPKEAIRLVKDKLTSVQTMQINQQKRALRDGFDMDMMTADLVTSGEDCHVYYDAITRENERLFFVSITVMNVEKKKKDLESVHEKIATVVQNSGNELRPMLDMQEEGFDSSLPLGLNYTKVERTLTTFYLAYFIPFTTQELFMKGESLYYGLNALSNNMIMVDRKQLKTPNGLILGSPGSGKSFSTKREILNAFLRCKDDIIICDPEGEYYPLVNVLNGQVIKLSSKSSDYINPMDVNLDIVYHPEKYRVDGECEDVDTIISDKAEFLISFCEMVICTTRNPELDGEEKSIIDHCVKEIYEKFLSDNPTEETMPTLQDFYDKLLEYAEDNVAAKRIASNLQTYVTGSKNVFNHRTNININNRVVCFNIRDLGATLRKVGMFIVQNMVWTRVSVNRALKKSTRYYVDEFHLLLAQPQTAQYSVEIWKRFRKWGGIPTGITQNVSDLLISKQVENIFSNSDFIYMLSQAKADRDMLAKKLNISPNQLNHITNGNAGEGLIFFNGVIVPFVDRYPKDTKTYAIMTTKLEETS